MTLDAPQQRSEGVEVYDVIVRNKGLRGLLLKNDAIWVKVDQGGALISNMGTLNIRGGEHIVDGGRVEAAEVEGEFDIVREPTTQELLLRQRIGLTEDIF